MSSHWLCRASNFHPAKDAHLKLWFNITKPSSKEKQLMALPPQLSLTLDPAPELSMLPIQLHYELSQDTGPSWKKKIIKKMQPNNCIGLPERPAHNEIEKDGGGKGGRSQWSSHGSCSVHAPIRCWQENQWDRQKRHHWLQWVLDK